MSDQTEKNIFHIFMLFVQIWVCFTFLNAAN